MKYQQSITSLVALAAAGELVAALAKKIVGNEVSASVTGEPLTAEMMLNMSQASIEKKLVACATEA